MTVIRCKVDSCAELNFFVSFSHRLMHPARFPILKSLKYLAQKVKQTFLPTKIHGGRTVKRNFSNELSLRSLRTQLVNAHKKRQLDKEITIFVFIFQTIDYTSPRGGISVLTSTSPRSSSTLLISSVGVRDSGKYSCQPSNAEMASVTVHIPVDGGYHWAIF